MVGPLGRGKRRGLFVQRAGARLVGSGLRERAIRLASIGHVALSAVEVSEGLRDEELAFRRHFGTRVGDLERSRLDGRPGRKRRRLRPVEIHRERERGGALLLRNVRLRFALGDRERSLLGLRLLANRRDRRGERGGRGGLGGRWEEETGGE